MVISGHGHSIRLEEITSRREVRELAIRAGTELIGDDYQAFSYLRILNVSANGSLDVVLCLSIQGVSPQVLLQAHRPHLVVGFDCQVVGFDLHSGSTVYEVMLPSPIQALIQVPEDVGTLVLTELGPLSISNWGERQWDYMDDLIEDYQLDGEILTLKFDGSRTVRLNVRTGSRID